MKLGAFFDMYDDWDGNVCLNDDELKLIIEGQLRELAENSSELLMSEVVSFGFYDNTLCIRLNTKKEN